MSTLALSFPWGSEQVTQEEDGSYPPSQLSGRARSYLRWLLGMMTIDQRTDLVVASPQMPLFSETGFPDSSRSGQATMQFLQLLSLLPRIPRRLKDRRDKTWR